MNKVSFVTKPRNFWTTTVLAFFIAFFRRCPIRPSLSTEWIELKGTTTRRQRNDDKNGGKERERQSSSSSHTFIVPYTRIYSSNGVTVIQVRRMQYVHKRALHAIIAAGRSNKEIFVPGEKSTRHKTHDSLIFCMCRYIRVLYTYMCVYCESEHTHKWSRTKIAHN